MITQNLIIFKRNPASNGNSFKEGKQVIVKDKKAQYWILTILLLDSPLFVLSIHIY